MKGLKLILTVVFLLVAVDLPAGENVLWKIRLPYQSVAVSYVIKGSENGSETLYIQNYGARRALYHISSSNVMGERSEDRTVRIEEPDYVYRFDLTRKSGMRMINPLKILEDEFASLSVTDQLRVMENARRLSIDFRNGVPSQIEPNVTTLLGRSCDRNRVAGTTNYTDNESGIVLKSETEAMGIEIETIATSFIKGPVDERNFALPAGIEAVHDNDTDIMVRAAMRQTIHWLGDPENRERPDHLLLAADLTEDQDESMMQGTIKFGRSLVDSARRMLQMR